MSRPCIAMKAKSFEERLLDKMTLPYIGQRKLNGLKCITYISEDSIQLRSSEGNIFETVPHIIEDIRNLRLPIGKYDGELYKHGLRLQEIQSIVLRKSLHPNHKIIEYHIYDCIVDNLKQIDRTMYMNSILMSRDTNTSIKRVESFPFKDKKNIPIILNQFMSEGYEGLIVRNSVGLWEVKRSPNLLKIKPREKDEYIIIGYNEEMSKHGEPKNALGAFICIKDGEEFKCGTGRILTKEGRELFWREKNKLIGKTLIVKYPELTSRGVPHQPVAYDIK